MAKKLLAAILVSSFLAGCGAASISSPSVGTDALIHANSFSSQDKADLLSNIDEVSDAFAEGEGSRSPFASGDRGGMIYRSLIKSKVLRTLGYGISYLPVKIKFGKAGKSDSAPRLAGSELQSVLESLEPGDVVQCGNNGSFVHSLFYLGDDQIVHALAQPGNGKSMIGVCSETFSGYFRRVERDQVVVLRPQWTPETLNAALTYAKAQVGKGYDTLFLLDSDDRFYCTELIYQILTTSGGAKIDPHLTKQKWRLITNEDIRKSSDLKVIYRYQHD